MISADLLKQKKKKKLADQECFLRTENTFCNNGIYE